MIIYDDKEIAYKNNREHDNIAYVNVLNSIFLTICTL